MSSTEEPTPTTPVVANGGAPSNSEVTGVHVACLIPCHVDWDRRRDLLLAAVQSVVHQVDEVVVSISGGLARDEPVGNVTILRHNVQRSQFEHFSLALANASPATTHVLLMDDDDLASADLVSTWLQRCVRCTPRSAPCCSVLQ
jgi:hypothetical protein